MVDQSNNQPLAGATVYYEGTTLASLTNEQGDFILVFEPKLKRPIVVSYIGYLTVYVEGFTADEPLLVTLTVEVNSLKEVVVKKDRFSRSEKMTIFKERFLGTTPFGLKCRIENEDDIELEYDEKTFMLKAYSEEPLVIINPSLGYKVNYEMIDFEVQFSALSVHPHAITGSYYAGLSHYQDLGSNSVILKRREEAYKGSPLHFFRNLITGVWGKDDFTLFFKGNQVKPEEHFTVTNEGDKFRVDIKRQKTVHKSNNGVDLVAYFGMLYGEHQHSTVYFNQETIYVDPFGNNFSMRSVSFSGAIQTKRIGDSLPLNYGL